MIGLKPLHFNLHRFKMLLRKSRDHYQQDVDILYIIETVWAHVWWFFFWSKHRTWTKNLKRNFSLTANWPLNQLCLLRYANDREAERWLKLPFNSSVHCFTFNTNWLQMKESHWFLIPVPKVAVSYHHSQLIILFHNIDRNVVQFAVLLIR